MSRKPGDWEVDVAAMAGSVVHEIKNPLSTLSINAQLLLEEWADAATPREVRTVRRLKIMAAEVQRLETIIQSFLRFTERHELNLREASLNGLLEDLEEFIATVGRLSIPDREVGLFSAHQMGTCRMGADPATSVAGPWGELHDVGGVWIGDASAFPTASGTNPMFTTMSLAHRTARAILAG